MKFFLSFMAALVLSAPMAQAATDITKTNHKVLEQELDSGKNKLVITFHATWCPACKTMLPKLDAAEKRFTTVKFFRIDIDKAPELATGVGSVPFTVFIDGKKVKGVIPGAPPTQKAFEDTMKHVLDLK